MGSEALAMAFAFLASVLLITTGSMIITNFSSSSPQGTAMAISTLGASSSFVYQESPNSIVCSGLWHPTLAYNCAKIYDGSVSTFGTAAWQSSGVTKSYAVLAYSIPAGKTSALFQWKAASLVNATVPSSCFSAGTVKMNLTSYRDNSNGMNSYAEAFCWNGASWLSVSKQGGTPYIYEEAMWWGSSSLVLSRNYKAAVVVFNKSGSVKLTSSELNAIEETKKLVQGKWNSVTPGSTLDMSDPTYFVDYSDLIGKDIGAAVYRADYFSSRFYADHPSKKNEYDFIIIFDTFSGSESLCYTHSILHSDLPGYCGDASCKLKSTIFMKNIRGMCGSSNAFDKYTASRIIIHEIGHMWLVYRLKNDFLGSYGVHYNSHINNSFDFMDDSVGPYVLSGSSYTALGHTRFVSEEEKFNMAKWSDASLFFMGLNTTPVKITLMNSCTNAYTCSAYKAYSIWDALDSTSATVAPGIGNMVDRDGDGIVNWAEVQGTFIYKTDPYNADTDSDGASDYQEYLSHTNPLSSPFCGDGICSGNEGCRICASDCVCKSSEVCNSLGVCDLPRCSNGVAKGTCTSSKPVYCNASLALVSNCALCGCPSGQSCDSAKGTCFSSAGKCSDGTAYGSCNVTSHKYCSSTGVLSFKCSCGSGACVSPQVCNVTSGACSLASWSYQEKPNAAACSGSWHGSYPCANTYDGNAFTFGTAAWASSGVTKGYAVLTYNVLKGATQAKFQWKADSAVNATLPSACFVGGAVKMNVTSYRNNSNSANNYAQASCWNGASWVGVSRIAKITNGCYVYEEAMWWR